MFLNTGVGGPQNMFKKHLVTMVSQHVVPNND